MKKIEAMADRPFIFGEILIAANLMDTLMERELTDFDITTKQWFLSMILNNLFDSPPTIKELAREMGSSHQNVKQVALKLQAKGLVLLEKDEKDARVTRLMLTEKGKATGTVLMSKVSDFTNMMFSGIEKDELVIVRKVLMKLLENIGELRA